MIRVFRNISPGRICAEGFEVISAVVFFFSVVFLFAPNFQWTLQGGEFERNAVFLFGVVVSLFATIVAGIIRGTTLIPPTALIVPFGLFLVAYGISAVLGGDVWRSVWGSWEYPGRGFAAFVAYAGMVILAIRLLRTGKSAIIYGALFFGIAMATVFAGFGEGWLHRGFSEDPTLPILWTMPLCILFGVVQKMLMQNTALARGIVIAVWILTVAVCFFVAYRFGIASWLWMFVALTVWCFFALLIAVARDSKRSWFPVITFLIVIVAYALGSIASNASDAERFSLPITESVFVIRNAMSESFWLGTGPTSYGTTFLAHRSENAIMISDGDFRAGLLWELPVTSGIFGAAAFVFLLLSLAGLSMRFDRVADDGIMIRIPALLSAFISWSVVLLFPTSGSFIAMAFLFSALAIASGESKRGARLGLQVIRMRPKPEYALSAAFVFVVLFSGVGYVLVVLSNAVLADREARFAIASETPEASIAYLEKASEKQPFEGWYDVLLGERFVELAESIPVGTEDEESIVRLESLINSASDRFSRAQEKLPNDAPSRVRIGDAYAQLAAYVPSFLVQSQAVYADAVVWNPRDSLTRIRLGETAMRRAITVRDPEEKKAFLAQAREALLGAVSSERNEAQAKYLLAIVEEGLGNIEEATQYAEDVLLMVPEDNNAKRLVARLFLLRDEEGDRKRGIDLYESIIVKESCDTMALAGLGDAYATENTQKAREFYDQAIVCADASSDMISTQSIRSKRDALSVSDSASEEEMILEEGEILEEEDVAQTDAIEETDTEDFEFGEEYSDSTQAREDE
jgi:tetratricopeptide (TPR) repeat protein